MQGGHPPKAVLWLQVIWRRTVSFLVVGPTRAAVVCWAKHRDMTELLHMGTSTEQKFSWVISEVLLRL